jgi:hypothetical protein
LSKYVQCFVVATFYSIPLFSATCVCLTNAVVYFLRSTGSNRNGYPDTSSSSVARAGRRHGISQSLVPHLDECSLGARYVDVSRYKAGVSRSRWNSEYDAGGSRVRTCAVLIESVSRAIDIELGFGADELKC